MGVSLGFHNLPWNRCLEMVRQSEMDGVLDAAKRPEFLQGPASFSLYTNTFWVHRNSESQTFDADALVGKTVGLVSGYTYPEDLIKMLEAAKASIDYAVDDETNIRKLAFGRVDTIVADYANTTSIAHSKNLNIRPLSPTHSSDYLYPTMNAALVSEQRSLNAALEDLLAEGVVDQIYRNHLGVGFDELDVE